MAVTKIKAIRSTLDKAIRYICNPEKTQGMLLVDSHGCVPEFAAQQMEATAKQNKRGGCRKAYHLMQSFAPDDNITPEKALEIGRQFADGVTRGKHQYVIAVHTDRGHIHCHIIFNAVDSREYKKYRYAGYSERDRIRDISDQLCRDNGLSVPPRWTKGKGHKPQYKKSWRRKLGEAIDRTVAASGTFEEFVTAMEVEEGYTFRNGKRIAFITEGQEKYSNCDQVGDYYTEEMIRDRIANKEKYRDVDLSLRTRHKKKNIPEQEVQTEEVWKGAGMERDSSGSRPAAMSPGTQKKTDPEKETDQEDPAARKKTDPEQETNQEDPGSREKTDPEQETHQEDSGARKKTGPEKEGHRTDPGSREGSKKSRKGSFSSEIRRIADLSKNEKAQNSPGYRHAAEKNNLNMFVKTMNFMEKHDIKTPEKFRAFYEARYDEVTRLNREIHQTDLQMSGLSERRHHIRIYFKHQKCYNTFMKYRNMRYYQEHQKEIQDFELSRKWLEASGINPREYRAQEYQDEYTRLRDKKNALKEKLQPAKEQLYTARNVMQNLESVLGIKFYEDEEKGASPESTVRDNVHQQEDREPQKKATDISIE